MTRRKFIQKLLKAGSAIFIGTSWVVKKAVPRKPACPESRPSRGLSSRQGTAGRFVRAVRLEKYPGSIKSLRDICKQNNWSG